MQILWDFRYNPIARAQRQTAAWNPAAKLPHDNFALPTMLYARTGNCLWQFPVLFLSCHSAAGSFCYESALRIAVPSPLFRTAKMEYP
ncbi:MAG: hypothetical protein LBK44_07360 [Spirochaetales bacterium]|nr:hypothetical protein [Spirochaetales bacterium]